MTGKIIQLLFIVSSSSIIILCSGEPQQLYDTSIRNGIPHVTNHAPQFGSSQFVELKKMYSIPAYGTKDNGDTYEISYISSMDLDEDENLYVLGPREREISVFDKNGNHLRTFGGRGQGPQELSWADLFLYDEGLLLIFEGFDGIKIWDTYGEYIKKLRVPTSNYEMFIISDNGYITGESVPSANITNWTSIFKKHSKDMLNSTEILSYNYSPYTDRYSRPSSLFAIDAKLNFYFPEDQVTYTMIKYNNSGDPLFSFSRDYDRLNYSQEAVDFFNSTFSEFVAEGRMPPLHDNPPVARRTLIDSHGYIWIVSGETAQDNNNPGFRSTVDIFDSEGKWLQSFKSTAVTLTSIIRNDRLYSPSLYNDKVEQFIDVFEIIYK